jgi:hypothetical protein
MSYANLQDVLVEAFLFLKYFAYTQRLSALNGWAPTPDARARRLGADAAVDDFSSRVKSQAADVAQLNVLALHRLQVDKAIAAEQTHLDKMTRKLSSLSTFPPLAARLVAPSGAVAPHSVAAAHVKHTTLIQASMTKRIDPEVRNYTLYPTLYPATLPVFLPDQSRATAHTQPLLNTHILQEDFKRQKRVEIESEIAREGGSVHETKSSTAVHFTGASTSHITPPHDVFDPQFVGVRAQVFFFVGGVQTFAGKNS